MVQKFWKRVYINLIKRSKIQKLIQEYLLKLIFQINNKDRMRWSILSLSFHFVQ